MKIYLRRLLYLIGIAPALTTISCSSPSNKHQCDCSQIGIDSVWADSSKVLCYKIPVRQTYGSDQNGKIYIAAIRAKKTGTSTEDPILYLHGGPGIATLENAKRYINGSHWNTLREKHDLVMFDYRGTGFSEPSLCEYVSDSLKAFGKTNPSFEAYTAKEKELYMKCRTSLLEKSIDIQSFSSFQMAADADEVRDALNIDAWNLYGVSYGTMVSLLYIRHFSSRLKSVVLDSPFPPNAPGFDFVRTMNSALNNIQKTVNEDSLTATNFPSVQEDFARTAKRLNAIPAKLDGMDFNGGDFANAMVAAFYKTDVVPLIPLALHEFSSGNDSLLATWVETLSSNDAYGKVSDIQAAAITCYECKPRTPADTPDSLELKYPHLASLSMSHYLSLCDTFRPERPDEKFFEAVKSDLPVLVLVGAYDPGTPPFYGEAAVQSLTNSTLIVVPNASHAAMHSSDCSFNVVKSFFQTPSTKPDLRCLELVPKTKFANENLSVELEKLKKKKSN